MATAETERSQPKKPIGWIDPVRREHCRRIASEKLMKAYLEWIEKGRPTR